MQDTAAASGRTPSPDRLPSLKAVQYFAAAARLQSFTAAGAELHVTQAAVSRMIQSLEEDLGLQLFDRRGRWISLTAAGKAYHQQVSQGLALIASASNQLRRGRESGKLTLVANRGFATLWLVRHLSDFKRHYPQMQITLLDEEAGAQARDDPAAVMIRFGAPPWPGEVATRLPVGPVIGVVCAPGLVAGKPLRHPDELARLPGWPMPAGVTTAGANFSGISACRRPNWNEAPDFSSCLRCVKLRSRGWELPWFPCSFSRRTWQAAAWSRPSRRPCNRRTAITSPMPRAPTPRTRCAVSSAGSWPEREPMPGGSPRRVEHLPACGKNGCGCQIDGLGDIRQFALSALATSGNLASEVLRRKPP